jgi:hypothetical protein
VHPLVLAIGRRGELGTDIEQLVLDAPEALGVPREVGAEAIAILRQEGAHDADDRVEFVDGAVRLEAEARLGHALAADQRR